MSIYNLKSLDATRFMIAKFDEDFNVLSTYTLAPAERGSGYSCDCPANQRSVITKLCRHRRMLPIMLGAVNTDRFYEPETGSWHQPLGDPHREPPEGPEAQPEITMIEGEMLKQVVGEAVPLSKAGVVGEALGSSTEPRLSMPDAIVGNQFIDLKTAPAQPAPTIRRR